MNSPPLLSAAWFPLRERAIATAVAVNANALGAGRGVSPIVSSEFFFFFVIARFAISIKDARVFDVLLKFILIRCRCFVLYRATCGHGGV